MVNNNLYNIALKRVSIVRSNNEFVVDQLIDRNIFKSDEIIVVNAMSNSFKPILLPKFKNRRNRELKKVGIDPYVSTSNLDFLKFVVDKIKTDYQIIVFGLAGLSHDSVTFLEEYLTVISSNENKTCVLLDCNPEYAQITIDSIGNVQN